MQGKRESPDLKSDTEAIMQSGKSVRQGVKIAGLKYQLFLNGIPWSFLNMTLNLSCKIKIRDYAR